MWEMSPARAGRAKAAVAAAMMNEFMVSGPVCEEKRGVSIGSDRRRARPVLAARPGERSKAVDGQRDAQGFAGRCGDCPGLRESAETETRHAVGTIRVRHDGHAPPVGQDRLEAGFGT